jgi:hypothetical protein
MILLPLTTIIIIIVKDIDSLKSIIVALMIFFFYLKLILGRREKISRYVDERTTRKVSKCFQLRVLKQPSVLKFQVKS